MKPRKVGRSRAVSLRLTSDALERLQTQAAELGLAPSTLAAVAVGEYLTRREATFPARAYPVVQK